MANQAAAALGRMARGVKKTMTKAAIAQRKRAGFKKGNKAAARKSNTQAEGRASRTLPRLVGGTIGEKP